MVDLHYQDVLQHPVGIGREGEGRYARPDHAVEVDGRVPVGVHGAMDPRDVGGHRVHGDGELDTRGSHSVIHLGPSRLQGMLVFARHVRVMGVVPKGREVMDMVAPHIGDVAVFAPLSDEGVVTVSGNGVVVTVGGNGGKVVKVHDPGYSIERVGVARKVDGHLRVVGVHVPVVHRYLVVVLARGGDRVVVSL